MNIKQQKVLFTNVRRINSKQGNVLLFADMHTGDSSFPVLIDDEKTDIKPLVSYIADGLLIASQYNNRLSLSVRDLVLKPA